MTAGRPATLGHQFPDPRIALTLALDSPADLAAYIDQLAAPALYSLAHPSTRARLKLALYSYALDPDSQLRPLFFPPTSSSNTADSDAASVSDDWALATAQQHARDATDDDEYGPSRRGKPCAHVFRQGESVYRCRDCGTDPTCVLCARCFHASSHARDGHDVTVSTHAGVGAGCCDCGDQEAWKPGRQRDCRYHGLDAPAPPLAHTKGKERATEADERADAAKERVAAVLSVAMDWALDAVERSPEVLRSPTRLEEITGAPRSVHPGRAESADERAAVAPDADADAGADEAVAMTPRPTLASLAALLRAGGGAAPDPEAVLAGLARADGTTVIVPEPEVGDGGQEGEGDEQDGLPPPGRLLEQIMRQMQQAPGVTGVVVDRDGNPVAVQTAVDDLDEEHTPAVLLPGAFPSSAPRSAPTAAPLPSPTTPPYAVVLWNDEQHSFREVIDQVSLAVGCSAAAASGVATRVDTIGRDVILVTPSAAEALRVARTVAQIKLVVSVREARETFREQCAAEVLVCARDLLRARLGTEGPGALADVVARVLLERAGDGRSRFMRWAEVEARMWKAPRKVGQEIAVALMGLGGKVKTELGVQYAEMYSSLATTYLLTDREPEHSLIFFGVQVFTVPSIAALLVSRHYFLSRLLKVLTAFLTGQVSPDRTRLVLPPNPAQRALDLDSPLIAKQRRYFQLFSDLTHLIQCAPVQRLIASSPHLLDDLAGFAALFERMNPLTRASGAHVEYESDQWSTAFNLTIQLARVCRAFGAAFHPSPTSADHDQNHGHDHDHGHGDGPPSTLDLARALNTLLARLAATANVAGQGAPLGVSVTHDVSLAGARYGPLVRHSVSGEPVSYHHPLAWLWAEMAKGLAGPRASDDALRGVGVSGVRALLGGEGRDGELLGMVRAMEEPLSVVALVAQVRSGVWVRNGFTVRAQNLHYRDYSLRETTFEQDLFFLQTALVVLDPSLVVAALVDRFELRDWLVRRARPQRRADGKENPYEPEQALAMIDELLNLVITLVSDPTHVVPLAPAAALRRELVHYLALGPCVYSDLLRRVSERFSDDPNIDRLLAEIATFKPPSGANDQGTYALRSDFLAEVDPYFARYSRNQREEADAAVRAWMKKKRGAGAGVEPVLVPRRLPVVPGASGPFQRLPHALGADALLAVVFYALRAGCCFPPAPRDADAAAAAVTSPEAAPPLFSEAVVDQALQLALLAHVEAPDALAAFAVRAVALENPDGAYESLAEVLVRVEEDERLKGVAHKARFLLDWLVGVHGAAVSRLRRPGEVENEQAKASDAALAVEAKRAAAKARQEAIMRQFQQAQSAFLQSVEDDEDADGDEAAMQPAAAADDDEGKARIEFGDCIVCQDALEDTQPFGILALVQGSNLIRLTPGGPSDEGDDLHVARPRRSNREAYLREVVDLPQSLDRDISELRPYGVAGRKVPLSGFADSGDGLAEGFPQTTKEGIAATSCGHMMHLACFERYCRSLEQRHHSQPTRCHPENLERREFVCPLCKSLGNVLLPAEVDSPAFLPFAGKLDTRSLAQWGQPDADPLEESSLARFDATFHNRVDKLSLLKEHGDGCAFKPWRATMALPMLLPAHFNDAEGRMVARLLQVVTALQSEIGGPGHGVATLSGDLVGYTVSSLEIASRGTAEPAWALSDASVRLLQSLVAAMQDLAELMTQSVESARIAAVSVRQRLGGVFAQGTKFADMPFTQVDPLGAVIEAAVCMPSAFYHVVSVAFYTALAQNLLRVCRLLHACQDTRATWDTDEGSALVKAECRDLARVRNFFAVAPALFGKDNDAFHPTLGKLLHAQMVVFLRRASIVARVAFGSPSDEAIDTFMDDDERSEYARLLELLRIPPPSDVLRSSDDAPADPTVSTLRAHLAACRDSVSETLFSTPDLREAANALLRDDSVGELEHPVPYELLGLPHQLDTLIAAALETPCQRCGDVPRDPAFCLFCGETLCAQSFCCMLGEKDAMHGECNEHMWTCGGSVGAYYLVKSNVILYLHADKGSFSTPPYLDSHGEVDVGGRRGRSQFPQYLHRGRYDEVRRLWLSHGIPTFVARKLEASNNPGGWHAF
ncbi:hypothetical protein JCM3770_006679 [Rhodotorula araucariae]